jgi:hypothetical protein
VRSAYSAGRKQQASLSTTQAEIADLEAHVDELQRQLEQSRLDSVNKRAQVATLTALTARGSLPQAPQADAMAAEDGGPQDPASAMHHDPWDISAHNSDEVITWPPNTNCDLPAVVSRVAFVHERVCRVVSLALGLELPSHWRPMLIPAQRTLRS